MRIILVIFAKARFFTETNGRLSSDGDGQKFLQISEHGYIKNPSIFFNESVHFDQISSTQTASDGDQGGNNHDGKEDEELCQQFNNCTQVPPPEDRACEFDGDCTLYGINATCDNKQCVDHSCDVNQSLNANSGICTAIGTGVVGFSDFGSINTTAPLSNLTGVTYIVTDFENDMDELLLFDWEDRQNEKLSGNETRFFTLYESGSKLDNGCDRVAWKRVQDDDGSLVIEIAIECKGAQAFCASGITQYDFLTDTKIDSAVHKMYNRTMETFLMKQEDYDPKDHHTSHQEKLPHYLRISSFHKGISMVPSLIVGAHVGQSPTVRALISRDPSSVAPTITNKSPVSRPYSEFRGGDCFIRWWLIPDYSVDIFNIPLIWAVSKSDDDKNQPLHSPTERGGRHLNLYNGEIDRPDVKRSCRDVQVGKTCRCAPYTACFNINGKKSECAPNGNYCIDPKNPNQDNSKFEKTDLDEFCYLMPIISGVLCIILNSVMVVFLKLLEKSTHNHKIKIYELNNEVQRKLAIKAKEAEQNKPVEQNMGMCATKFLARNFHKMNRSIRKTDKIPSNAEQVSSPKHRKKNAYKQPVEAYDHEVVRISSRSRKTKKKKKFKQNK